jgi:hypothetical protein
MCIKLRCTDRPMNINRLLSDSYGSIAQKDWRYLEPGRWANDNIIEWCIKWVNILFDKFASIYMNSYISHQQSVKDQKLDFHLMPIWFLQKWKEYAFVLYVILLNCLIGIDLQKEYLAGRCPMSSLRTT